MNKKNPLITFICFIVVATIFASAFIPFPIVNGSKQVPWWYFILSILFGIYFSFKSIKKSNKNEKSFYNSSQKVTSKKPDLINNSNGRVSYSDIPKGVDKDYQTAIFLWKQNGMPIREIKDYPVYIYYDLGITNPKKFHESLLLNGYLKTANISTILKSYKVIQLKEICDNLNLSKSGKKNDLIATIISSADPDYLSQLSNESNILELSQTGQLFIESHYDFVQFYEHRYYQVDLKEYLSRKKYYSNNASFYAIMLEILMNKESKYKDNSEYHNLIIIRLNIARLFEENDEHEKALYYFLSAAIIAFSGITSYYLMDSDLSITNDEYIKNNILNASVNGIVNSIANYENYYTEDMVDIIYRENKLPYNCCPSNLMKKIVNDIFNNLYDQDMYSTIISNNFLKEYRKYKSSIRR